VKLFYSPYSPFARKVLVLAEERGLAVERVATQVSPVERNHALAAHNPAAKLPTLLLPDGTALFDSRVIAEYLDALPGGARFFPAPPARWAALTLQSLADEMLDACLLLRYETLVRPESARWPAWLTEQRAKVDGSLDALEARWLDHLAGPLDIGVVAVGCALGYLDLRFPDHAWRERRPKLAGWYAGLQERPSMKVTAPPPA
jgi:glutathione S-transferase